MNKNVEEAKRRMREAHPELADESDADRHARLQAHVPRMCEWIRAVDREGMWRGSDRVASKLHWARNHLHQFEVDVAEDHAAMSAGVVSVTVFVSVAADTFDEAHLAATQMASRHGIATSVRSMGR